jgi:hypothetical protein
VTAHELLVLVHVLLFVYWLGTDLGVYYVSYRVLDRELAPATRGAMARVLLNLDLAPRICLVLTLPVGLTLASNLGAVPLGGAALGAIWVAALAWLGVVLSIHRAHGTAVRLTLGDGIFRGVLVVSLFGLVVWSLVTGGPLRTAWVPLKVGLFAIAVGCGLGIRILLRQFGPALGALLAGDTSPGVEETLSRSLARTRPLVLVIWACVVSAAALGIAKP